MVTVGAWHVGEVFLSMLWFVLFFIWVWLAVMVFIDIFRSHDLSGWLKALWVVGIIIFPILGVLLYLIVRGSSMHQRAVKETQQADDQFRAYVQTVAGTTASPASEIERLEGLRTRGVITDEEFQSLKAKVMAGAS
jgi:hypothetical protein